MPEILILALRGFPLTYPSAPTALVLAWENQLQLATNPTIDRRNGGTELRSDNFQINRTLQTQSIKVNIVSSANRLTIDNFFRSLYGTPFYFNGGLWEIQAWDWGFNGGGSDATSVFSLAANLVQVYRP